MSEPNRPSTKSKATGETKTSQPWLWNVVLLDDQEHSDVYVIRMVQELFSRSAEQGQKVAETVDKEGRAILMTTHKEHAELKRDQILAYGRDPQVSASTGSMKAVLEPSEQDGNGK